MKELFHDDFNLYIGQTAHENTELVLRFQKDTSKECLWFHLKSFPSCHIVLTSNKIETSMIIEASKACLEHTKYRHMKNVKVNYCSPSNLIVTGTPGTVEFKSNRQVKTITL